MRLVSETYGGEFLNSDDVTREGTQYVIDGIEDDLHDGKFIMNLHGEEKRLILNKTNANYLQSRLGDDVDEWAGATVWLRRGTTTYEKKKVACVEIYNAVKHTNGTSEEAHNVSKETRKR